MSDPFSMLANATVRIQRADGTIIGPLKCIFKKGQVRLFDKNLVVARGDKVFRDLPNGREELHQVIEVDFSEGHPSGMIPPSWVLSLAKADSASVSQAGSANFQLVGDNNTVHIPAPQVSQAQAPVPASTIELETLKPRPCTIDETLAAHELGSSGAPYSNIPARSIRVRVKTSGSSAERCRGRLEIDGEQVPVWNGTRDFYAGDDEIVEVARVFGTERRMRADIGDSRIDFKSPTGTLVIVSANNARARVEVTLGLDPTVRSSPV